MLSFLFTLLAVAPASAQAPTGGTWSPYGSGAPWSVEALALGPDGAPYALYAVPRLNGVDSTAVVARWDGSAWSALPAGLSCFRGCGGGAIAVGPDAAVYVSVSETGATGSTNYLEVWRGTGWTDLFNSVYGGVSALRFAPDATLYVGGRAVNFPGSTNPVARLTGSALAPVGTDAQISGVSSLAVAPDGTLYAGGTTQSNEARIARWDGTAWTAIATGWTSPSPSSAVYALAVAPDGTLYAAGTFTTPDGLNRIARWNGTAWEPLGSGIADGEVRALAVTSDGAVYAGGTFTMAGGVATSRIARWDGSAWSALGTGLDGRVTSIQVTADGALVVGGSFATAGSVAAANVARYVPAPVVAGEPTPGGAAQIALENVSPNPATGRASIGYTVPSGGLVRLAVYDVLGREVAVVLDGEQAAGRHEATFEGSHLTPGVYVVRLEASGAVATRRLTLTR